MPERLQICLGWDSREGRAYTVAEASFLERTSRQLAIRSVSMESLCDEGWYWRPTERREGRLWDVISEAPMSTEHAIARFFLPHLYEFAGCVLFTDSDVLVRSDVAELFQLADERFAVQVVKHAQMPCEATKMDGQVQTCYPRKNWSSVVLWNCAHPSHRVLTLDVLNSWPGRDLHTFRWLKDEEIGDLPLEWNYLVGVSQSQADVKLAHFTRGLPDMPGYETCEFADEWLAMTRSTWLERAI